ncbi:MAG TPA: isoprenylcysteine carboxylmethyltransferase family protein [Polyangiaceae bacterium]|nr:isoprenylcysteine carboxylmethyltransferase family protein [Polyangiaceae bacterium]
MVTTQVLYSSFLALLAGERGIELLISRRNARAASAHCAVETGQGHYRVMAALHAAFLVSCAAEVWLLDRAFSPGIGFVALGVALLAQVLRYSAIAALGQRWSVRIIVWPAAPPVTRGPYRFMRHPNYVAVGLELLFVPLMHGAFLTAVAFSACNAVLLTVRIRAEEQALGEIYAKAFRGRPRLFPSFARRERA